MDFDTFVELQYLLTEYEKEYNSINQSAREVRDFPGSIQLIREYIKITNPKEADTFFQNFGVGDYDDKILLPFERQCAYVSLLQILLAIDKEREKEGMTQYHKIHKGTPYYFIGITAYKFNDFSKAMFYMDAAVSEDLKLPDFKSKEKISASLGFFLLKEFGTSHLALIKVIMETLKEYKPRSGGNITIESFREKFVNDLLYSDAERRSLLTALYTFLSEYVEKKQQLTFRSDIGGSIQPFLDHLFDGARILESLLTKDGDHGSDLKAKIRKKKELEVSNSVLEGGKGLKHAKEKYLERKEKENSFQDCNFASAYIIRNTTGHSLLWQDQFTPESYKILYNTLVNSIFWTIEKLWINKECKSKDS